MCVFIYFLHFICPDHNSYLKLFCKVLCLDLVSTINLPACPWFPFLFLQVVAAGRHYLLSCGLSDLKPSFLV